MLAYDSVLNYIDYEFLKTLQISCHRYLSLLGRLPGGGDIWVVIKEQQGCAWFLGNLEEGGFVI